MTAPQRPAPPPLAQPAPLFALQTVLFPGGLLQLKVFEARYLDLISHCLRTQSGFAVVCMREGSEVRPAAGATASQARFEPVAVQASVLEVDAEQAGILTVRCLGGTRLRLGAAHQREDGLWLAAAEPCTADVAAPVPDALQPAADALIQAIAALAAQDQHPFMAPHQLDDAGWVANRWCEILPIPLPAKQRLMVLDDPALRLALVDEFLRGKGVY